LNWLGIMTQVRCVQSKIIEKFGTSIKIRLNEKFESTEFETMRVNCISIILCCYIYRVYWHKYWSFAKFHSRLTRISRWVEFLSKSQTSLCINIYNLTPVESKFRLSRIKVLVPRCRKPYYLHSLSRIYTTKGRQLFLCAILFIYNKLCVFIIQ
jgi:hypothetical protein